MHRLSIANVTLSNFQLNTKIFDSVNQHEIYFIPKHTVDLLLKHISADNSLNNFNYIRNVLEVVSHICRRNQEAISSQSLRDLNQDYASIIKSYQKTFIDRRKPFNKDKGECFIYVLRPVDEWSFVLLENSEETKNIKTFENLLDKNHPANNDNYIYTLCNAKIDTKAAILANYELLKLQPFEEHPVLKHGPITVQGFGSRVNNILRFTNHRYIKKGENTNRVFSSFVLDRISRRYITINNKTFFEIDIKNCQPLLLAILLLSDKMPVEEQFIEDVVSGIFYAKFQETAAFMNITEEKIFNKDTFKTDEYLFSDYDSVKELIYRSVLFGCKSVNKSRTAEIFNKLYPQTYQSCLQINEKISLALTLQNKEAKVIFSVTPNCYYYTVHDAVYVVDHTEMIDVKTKLNETICNISESVICCVNYKFGDNEPHYFINNIFEAEPQTITIKNKTKEHTDKLKRLNDFRDLFYKLDKKTLIEVMKISEKTYTRYKKQL